MNSRPQTEPPLVAVTPYGDNGASARVRIYGWLRHLGIASDVHSFLGAASSSFRELRADPHVLVRAQVDLHKLAREHHERLLLHREASPLSRGRLEAKLLSSSSYSVLDLDDALAWDVRPSSDPVSLFPKPTKIARAAAAADTIVVGSPSLLEWATTVAEEVSYIPSCVDMTDYPPKTSYELTRPPLLGWIGSPSTEVLLERISGDLLQLHRLSGARLRVISGPPRSLGPLDAMVDRIQWTTQTAHQYLAESDIAIAPMGDSAFLRGKCAYKILQYGASRLPIVGSPVGANADALALLGASTVDAGDSWTETVMDMINAPASERQRMGEISNQAVLAHYSYTAWQDEWKRVMHITDADLLAPPS